MTGKGKADTEVHADVHRCQNEKEFLSTWLDFSHVSAEWDVQRDAKFIFRGVSDSSWELLPTALRFGTDEKNTRLLEQIASCRKRRTGNGRDAKLNLEDDADHIRAEMEVVRRFYQMADANGLRLPHVHELCRAFLLATDSEVDELEAELLKDFGKEKLSDLWPSSEILPIIGLAQHHGLPTRLLDWSLDPFVAVYFAASGATKRLELGGDRSGELAVWYMCANHLTQAKHEFNRLSVELVTAPMAENPNLAAQRGVFTAIVPRNGCGKEAYYSLDKVAVQLKPPLNVEKRTLSIKKAPNLLAALRNMGYTAGRIFPGFDGAADAVRDLAAIEKHIPRKDESMPTRTVASTR